MFSDNSTSDDEPILQNPPLLHTSYRNYKSVETSSSPVNSVKIETVSDDVLRIWSQLPEPIRLDPSLEAYKEEYEKVSEKKKCDVDEEKKLMDELHDELFKGNPCYRYLKSIALFSCWITFTVILMTTSERTETFHEIVVSKFYSENYMFINETSGDSITVTVESPLIPYKNDLNYTEKMNSLTIWLDLRIDHENKSDEKGNETKVQLQVLNISETWIIPLLPGHLVSVVSPTQRQKTFDLTAFNRSFLEHGVVAINFQTTSETNVPLSVAYDVLPIKADDGIIYAAIILIGLYFLIIFEIVHRTLAAMLASTMALALLAVMNGKPSTAEVISWIDVDTLLLLFSMMILVAVFADTGIFDYLAVYAYKITNGSTWPLINTLCFFTAFISAFLDNVTTVLLMTPVTIRLCEVMQLNPVPILTTMVIYSNIGGAMTPVGDPPNVIISSNRQVINSGVDFSTFTLHMGIGVLIVIAVVSVQIRFIFHDTKSLRFNEPPDVQELRHEITIWQKAAASLSSYSKDESFVRETLTKKVRKLISHLNKKLTKGNVNVEHYTTTLEELQEKYPIRDKWLLAKTGCALSFVIILFFLHSLPELSLSLGWTALLGALLLLVLTDSKDLDGLMARVEWSTLLFFGSLFILMEALSKLGLIAWIGNQTEKLILSVNEDSRLGVAIILLLWVSAIASAFVDNVPLTTMMIRIATNLVENHDLDLPLQPLVWALAFGACLGGNGTLIGATANVVCAGIVEQHGYRFTFIQFFKIGFPIMITSIASITIYLIIVHVVFAWNGAD